MISFIIIQGTQKNKPGIKKFLILLTCIGFSAVSFSSTDPVRALLSDDPKARKEAGQTIVQIGDKRFVPSLLEIAFFHTWKKDITRYREINEILQTLTGDKSGQRYFYWLKWVGAHPEIKPLPEYFPLKRDVFREVDPAFAYFFAEEHSFQIRPEEIVWGGVLKDGIPALKNPLHLPAEQAGYLKETDKVFGVAVGNEFRAYPLKIMDWHEMANDVVGGRPVSLSYCTLCGSAILYSGRVGGQTFTFGSSGLLYRSNKLMYDHNTGSLWSELQGKPVAGKLSDQKILLEVLPIVLTTWSEWRRLHPLTTVLSLDTGYQRDYDTEPYKQYFESKAVMFPVPSQDNRLAPKDFIFAIRSGIKIKAYPAELLMRRKFLKDRLGDSAVVLVSDEKGIRSYSCDNASAEPSWNATEEFLTSPDGLQKCSRLPGHLAYWFGWYAQFPTAELYKE